MTGQTLDIKEEPSSREGIEVSTLSVEHHLESVFARTYNHKTKSIESFLTVKLDSVFSKSFNQLFPNIEFEAFVNVRTNSDQNKSWDN